MAHLAFRGAPGAGWGGVHDAAGRESHRLHLCAGFSFSGGISQNGAAMIISFSSATLPLAVFIIFLFS